MAELVSGFLAMAGAAPARPAVIAPGETLSFGELRVLAEGFAARLEAGGVRRGDRLLLAMPVSPRLYAALAGAWLAGAAVVFPEPTLGLRGLRHAIGATRPHGLIATGPYRALRVLPGLWGLPAFAPGPVGGARTVKPPAPSDTALISFTTGSTGRPKAIARSHGFLAAQNAALAPVLAASEGTRDLVGFPAFVLAGLAAGRTSVLPGRPVAGRRADPAALARQIGVSGATRLLLPPAACAGLAANGLPAHVAKVFTGGGPVFPDLIDGLQAARPEVEVIAVYGSTEAEPVAVLDAREIAGADRRAMAAGGGLLAGRPVPELALRIVDDEILVAGPHVNAGYLDPADDTANKLREGGRVWHRTGDAGRLDGAGRLWLLGRLADRAETPLGPRYPFQIELPARGWPGVRGAALLGGQAPVLCLEGDAARARDYRTRAAALGIADVQPVPVIPLDRRHGSKLDRARLARLVRRPPH
ncbi:acyl-CoA synthetase (AMP-forming)/AMP-acid ligase II [Rhodovulum iodosum]|uniref:Acyl-CoA synthetase (AMP-forming)/AMP-acid ligase II n=1 Tax=Rhodovulum iodosum TaxID=68291 RepID=A0ABV3XPC0_9RHOB|nr:AMP-binding protein [Rhodovulum robiginosum]RSK31531.1 hypothetical protein EJA01_15480 [Rhodovulum robiginosum]